MLRERLLFLKDHVLYNTLLKRPRLCWATIYTNYSCNYRCRHCYGAYGDRYGVQHQPDSTLTFEQMGELVRNLRRSGCRYLALLGGEPLLHDDLGRIVQLVRSHGMELSIVTNGSLVTKRLGQLRGVSTLCFSIDGSEASNDALRGKGAYARSLEAIAVAKSTKANIHINATVYRESAGDMGDLVEYANRQRIHITLNPLMYQSYIDERYAYLRPSDDDYRRLFTWAMELKRRGYPLMYSMESYRTLLNWPDFDQVIRWNEDPDDLGAIGFPKCFAGRHYMYIGAEGDVYPCSQLIGTDVFKPKNVFRDGFDSAWEHARKIPCRACTNLGFLDINLILAWRWRALFAMGGQSLKEYAYARQWVPHPL